MITAEHATTGHRELERELRRFVARRIDRADVDDVVQDVFVRLQRGVAALSSDAKFGAWVLRVARSAIAEARLDRARHPLSSHDAPEPEPEPADESDAIERQLAACVPVFVAMLPRTYREAVTLTDLQGLTQREAAELLGVSWSGMKSRVQRGRQRLRELFEACCAIGVDVRGRVVACEPRACCTPSAIR